MDGARWRVRTGVPWHDLPPPEYGHWQTVYGPWQPAYGLFRRWQRQGAWARSRENRAYLCRRGTARTIPEPTDQVRNRRGRAGGRPPAVDRQEYKVTHANEWL